MIERSDPLRGERFQILNEAGEARAELDPGLPALTLRRIYADLVLTRTADTKAFNLQRQGRLGTYASSRGHEGVQVGMASAMVKDDWFFPYFRDLGAYVTLGFPLRNFYLYWMGNEEGMRIPESLRLFTIAIPVGSQILHAVGAGLASNLRNLHRAVLCTFGDGATSEGDFHEALNAAGVFKTPNVFLCVNNQWAISTPRKRQTASPTIAQKAVAYGFSGIQVDGNDVLAVFVAVKEAMEKARTGGGPTLVEAFTYRLSDHTTADDATRYRSKAEVAEWEKRDPIERFRLYLKAKGFWNEEFEKEVREKSAAAVEKAVGEAEGVPSPAWDEVFAYTYKELPPGLAEQLTEAKRANRGGGR